MTPRKPVVLLVEDNQGDYLLTKLGFERASIPVTLFWVENGEDAMAFLHQSEPYNDLLAPDLILLSLKLPVQDGMTVLEELCADPRFKHIPIVALAVSPVPEEVRTAYQSGCATLMIKPLEFETYAQMIQSLCDFWFKWSVLPGLI